ncbi:MAG TPA: alpha-2-macroglobulin family protein [Longimicrobium sp.]|nr:alpha-2-macroglobulin family protein [Longimicrobium sp.]
MRAIPRLVPLLAAAIGTMAPGAAETQRRTTIPPLYVAPVYSGETAGAVDTVGLRFRIAEAAGRGRERQAVSPSTQLAAADAARILARLPALAAAATAADSFAFPARTLPPPRTGRVRLASFPPPDTAAPPRPATRGPAPLAIVRGAPRGAVEVGAEVTITFSQPMVPLSSVSTVQAREVPVRLSPQPAGEWRWIDVRTLVFKPRGRMPGATEYTVSIPAGTQSAAGGRLEEAASWTFTTTPLSAMGGQPYGSSVGLEPVIVIQFDQRINRAALLPHIQLLADRQSIPVRLATPAEIEADATAKALAQHGDSIHWIAVRPVRPLPRNAGVQVTVETGAPSAEGPLRTAHAQSWSFRTYGPLAINHSICSGINNRCRPGNPFYIGFTNPLDTAAFRPAQVRVEPAIAGMRVSVLEQALVITGRTLPNTRYTVYLDAGIRDVFGQTLGEPQQRTFDVAAPYPQLLPFGERMIVLDPNGPRRITVTSHDHARLRIRIHRVQPSDWPAFVPDRRSAFPGREVVNRVVETRGAPGQIVETVVDLGEALGSGPGHVIVGVEAVDPGEGKDQGTYVWVQSTRIGLAAFSDPTEVTAWATSLVDGAPLPGVRVTLGTQPGAGTTDRDGTARIPQPRRGVEPGVRPEDVRRRERGPVHHAYLVAELDGDRALLPAPAEALQRRDETVTVLWYGITDRNLYRPGEEVRFKGWARRFERAKTGGVGLPRPPDAEVAWLVRDPRGNEIAAGTARLTALGGFDGTFRVPEGSNLGPGSIELRLGGGAQEGTTGQIGFQVQEFRRPEYEVGIDVPPGPHVVGGSAQVEVRASYFAGGGLPGAPVSWTVRSQTAWFTPPEWGSWRFGMAYDYGYGARRQEPVVRTFEGTTDADGRHAVRIDFDRADPPTAQSLQMQATVVDVNRQPWTAQGQMLVHPAEVYVGLRTERAWLEAGQPIALGVVVVDLDGKPVAGRPVQVLAERMEWRRDGGSWGEVVADSARCTVVSDLNPVSCTFATGEAGGTYRITADVTDARGRPSRTRISTWAWGRSPWMSGPGEDQNAQRVVRLVPDREEYAPGDTARVLVQLPFWPARGLLTVRREGIVRTIPIASDGPTVAVEMPVEEADIPNVFLQVDVVGAHDREGQRQPTARGTDFASGNNVLRVPPGTRTLQVAVSPADSVQTPDSPGSVEVEVRDAAGRPVRDAEVAVVVVDEAVLALTGFQLQHPVQIFYPEWMPGVMDTHLRPLVRLVPDSVGAPGEVVGVVIDAQTRQPVAGATVSIEGTRLAAVTDASGRFRLAGVPPGRRTVAVARVGMQPARVVVEVGDQPLAMLQIELTTQLMLLEDMVVTAAAGEAALYMRAGQAAYNLPAPPSPVANAIQGKVAGADVAPAAIAVRSNFAALALWAPVVRTDAQGRARVPFTLPSNLTRYRVMAVAVSGGTLYGMDESALTARQPLMVRPSAPRFLNYGDRFDLPVVIQNQTDAPVTVDVAARGAGLVFADAGRRVTVPAHDRAEVRIPGEAVLPGTARVQIAAVGGSMSDAAEITLPVYTPATAEAFATYGSIAEDGAVDLPLEVPGDAIPAFGGLEVTTSSTALQELTDAFLYLVRYPYECAEQISSRLLAVAALRDVLTEFRAEGLPPAEVISDSVARDLAVLEGMQRGDGGFSFWPGDEYDSWPYVSIHVTHALLRVRERGYAVRPEMLESALEYVRDIETNIPHWYPQQAKFALRAYAAYTLDRAEDDDAGDMLVDLFDEVRLDTIPLEVAGWLLTASAGRAEFATQRAELLRIINNRATETASTATFATRYEEGEYLLLHSDRRTDAVILEALLAADPRSELITKTVRGLLGHRTAGRWNSTQENSWVLLALDRYFRVYEGQTPEFVARVWLGERFAGEERFTGRSADRGHLDVPMRVLVGDDPRSLTIGKDGPGRLYYRAGLRYAPRDLDLLPLERGFAVERTYEAVDDSADVVRGEDGRWRIKAGARVRITVTVTAPGRRVHVAMVDPLPAGFEAVNTALRGAEDVPPTADDGVAPWARGYRWWWGPWYEHQNLRDDRVEAFTSLLPAGVYTYSYVARATTPGLFVVPPPRAEEMYSPETFGRGGTERVIVLAEEEGRE